MNDRNDNPEDLSFLEAPVDQHLSVQEFHVITIQDTDDPPEVDLVLDVEHIETGHAWRQSINMGRDQFKQYVNTLVYAATTAGIDLGNK